MPYRLSRDILCKLAHRYGIQTEHYDALGKEQHVSNNTIVQLLDSFGIAIKNNTDILYETKRFDEQIITDRIEPIIVIWDKNDLMITIYIAESEIKQTINCSIMLENGKIINKNFNPKLLPTKKTISLNGEIYEQKYLSIINIIEYGYHKLTISIGQKTYNTFVISAPSIAYNGSADAYKRAGVFTPLHSLKSCYHQGPADLIDLKSVITMVAEFGGNICGVSPLNAVLPNSKLDNGEYVAASLLFWNENYISFDNFPISADNTIDSQKIINLKREITTKKHNDLLNNKVEKNEFDNYITANPEVSIYAAFRAKMEETGVTWEHWKDEDSVEIETLQESESFHYYQYAQWQMELQLVELKKYANTCNVLIYTDMALTVPHSSYDVWRYSEDFILNVNIGCAPNITLNSGKGYNLPPLNPVNLRNSHYRYFINCIRTIMDKVHILAINQAIGVYQSYWIPQGENAANGAYVSYKANELYAILCLESIRNNVILVDGGMENTIRETNYALDVHHIYKIHALQLQLEKTDFIDYTAPKRSVACLNMPPMPSFTDFCQGLDISYRYEKGLITESEKKYQLIHRKDVLANIDAYLSTNLHLSNGSAGSHINNLALKAFILLANSAANFFLINLKDLWQLFCLSVDDNVNNNKANQPSSIPLEKLLSSKPIENLLKEISRIRQSHQSLSGHNYLSEEDKELFISGKHTFLYNKLGAQIINTPDKSGVFFSTWAPNAQYVSVIGDFNDWNNAANPLQPCIHSGIWQGFIEDVKTGATYKYFITSYQPDYTCEKIDPFGFQHELTPKAISKVCALNYIWNDQKWLIKRKLTISTQSPISIYELHLSSWREATDANRHITYKELAPLISHHVNLMGFTHVAFLPLMESAAYSADGCQTIGYYAPSSRYGSAEEFMYMIDYLHQHDIGVILSWIPGYFAEDDQALSFFDGRSLYESSYYSHTSPPDWRHLPFDFAKNEVQSFLISNALYWLDKYHIDGLNITGISAIDKEWAFSKTVNDNEASAFFIKLNQAVIEHYPDVMMIAADTTYYPASSQAITLDSLGFSFKYDKEGIQDILRYFSHQPNYRQLHHEHLTSRLKYTFHEGYILGLSHQEFNNLCNLLNKLPSTDGERLANFRLILGLIYALPGKKLFFMGSEFGKLSHWHPEVKISWDLLQNESHHQIQRWVCKLNQLYRSEPALYKNISNTTSIEWQVKNEKQGIIRFIRRANNDLIFIILNSTAITKYNYRIGASMTGAWVEIANSDSTLYGGGGISQPSIITENVPHDGYPASIKINIPAYSIMYLKPIAHS